MQHAFFHIFKQLQISWIWDWIWYTQLQYAFSHFFKFLQIETEFDTHNYEDFKYVRHPHKKEVFLLCHQGASDGGATALGFWEVWGTPSLRLLTVPLWPRVLGSVRVPYMDQINISRKEKNPWYYIAVCKLFVLRIVT